MDHKLYFLLSLSLLVGCASTEKVCKPHYVYGDREYSNYNQRACRSDFIEICVETNVTLTKAEVTELITEASSKFSSKSELTAIRMEEWRSQLDKKPHIQVVKGSYHWIEAGVVVPWSKNGCMKLYDSSEEIVEFYLESDKWIYKNTLIKL